MMSFICHCPSSVLNTGIYRAPNNTPTLFNGSRVFLSLTELHTTTVGGIMNAINIYASSVPLGNMRTNTLRNCQEITYHSLTAATSKPTYSCILHSKQKEQSFKPQTISAKGEHYTSASPVLINSALVSHQSFIVRLSASLQGAWHSDRMPAKRL